MRVCVRAFVCVFACVFVRVCVRAFVCVFVRVCTRASVCASMCACYHSRNKLLLNSAMLFPCTKSQNQKGSSQINSDHVKVIEYKL